MSSERSRAGRAPPSARGRPDLHRRQVEARHVTSRTPRRPGARTRRSLLETRPQRVRDRLEVAAGPKGGWKDDESVVVGEQPVVRSNATSKKNRIRPVNEAV